MPDPLNRHALAAAVGSLSLSKTSDRVKTAYNKMNQSKHSLGDLVAAVASCARSERETVAALLDLFAGGRVKIKDHGHLKRVRILA